MEKIASPLIRKYEVSVIVVTYNQLFTLPFIIGCLLNQETDVSYEIVICDDGSNYGMALNVQKFAKSASIPIRYIWQQDRFFRAGQARNNGIKISNGKILIFLDGDMIPPLNLIGRHVKFHAEDTNLILAGNRFSCHDYALKMGAPFNNVYNLIQWIRKNSWINKEEHIYRLQWLRSKNSWRAGFSSHMSIKWSPDVYFDENLVGWGIEDWEFFYRMVKNGKRFRFIWGLVAYHIDMKEAIFNAFRNNNHNQMVLFAKNLLYFIDKYREDKSLIECALALRHYDLDEFQNTWFWNENKDYSISERIQTIRRWLILNKNPIKK